MENLEIVFLPKEKWKGTPVPLAYRNDSYYDLEISPMNENGCTVSLVRRSAEAFERSHSDSLYQDYWDNAEAYGIVSGDGEKMLACIEMCPEEWSNRLLITELFVHEKLRGRGYGHRLLSLAKDLTVERNYRVLMLETQSSNVHAVDFYLHEGFTLVGFDSCCYTNEDLSRKEVRFNMGWFPPAR